MQGKVLWNADTGLLDVGLAGDAESQWGAASSPVIHGNLVIVQNDRHANSFLAAYNLETGKQAWFTPRDEKPAWSTPAIFKGRRTEIITNGANFLRGNDPATGKELWRVSNDDSQVIVPSPVIAGDRVILTGGYPTGARPIQAIQLDSPSGLATIAWKAERGSPYTPTPLVYQGVVYALVDNGILNAYELGTGSVVYRTRVAIGAAFSASPVASDGKLYLASEDGSVYVAKAGREFSLLAQNDMGEVLMATPAISSGTLVVRGRSHLFGISSGTRR
jgi:outer membrane protein assembly factor BamB